MHFVLRSPLFPLFHHSLFANVFLARMPVSLFVCVFVSVPCVYLCLVWMCVCPIVLRKEFVKQLSNLFDVSFNKLTHTRARTHMHAHMQAVRVGEERECECGAYNLCMYTHTRTRVCVLCAKYWWRTTYVCTSFPRTTHAAAAKKKQLKGTKESKKTRKIVACNVQFNISNKRPSIIT